MIELSDSEIDGIHFTVIDTSGLGDDIEDAGNDRRYLELILQNFKVPLVRALLEHLAKE
jgi:septin family protein